MIYIQWYKIKFIRIKKTHLNLRVFYLIIICSGVEIWTPDTWIIIPSVYWGWHSIAVGKCGKLLCLSSVWWLKFCKRLLLDHKVAGSNPVWRTIKKTAFPSIFMHSQDWNRTTHNRALNLWKTAEKTIYFCAFLRISSKNSV